MLIHRFGDDVSLYFSKSRCGIPYNDLVDYGKPLVSAVDDPMFYVIVRTPMALNIYTVRVPDGQYHKAYRRAHSLARWHRKYCRCRYCGMVMKRDWEGHKC